MWGRFEALLNSFILKLIAGFVPHLLVLNIRALAILRKHYCVSSVEVEALARRNWGEN